VAFSSRRLCVATVSTYTLHVQTHNVLIRSCYPKKELQRTSPSNLKPSIVCSDPGAIVPIFW